MAHITILLDGDFEDVVAAIVARGAHVTVVETPPPITTPPAEPVEAQPYTPAALTNQQVFDAIGQVARALHVNLIGLMPNDLLDLMVAHRDRPYVGPPVQLWGLTSEHKRLIVEALLPPDENH